MTRINTIDPADLLDQHLMAEYRELPRIFGVADPRRSGLPSSYRMGAGHVLFFFDKTSWLAQRHAAIVRELVVRGYNLSHRDPLVPVGGVAWEPTPADHAENLGRLQERLDGRPGYYRLRGEVVEPGYYTGLRSRYVVSSGP